MIHPESATRAALFALALTCTGARADQAPLALTSTQIAALGVQWQAPRAVSAGAGATWSARVMPDPRAESALAAPAAGVVLSVPVAEGEAVRAGQVLAELASAEAPALAAQLQAAESAARLAREEATRDAQLHADGIIATRRLQASEQAAARATAELAAVQMRLRLLGLDAQDARSGRLRLRAPRAGTVLERTVSAGQPVQAAEVLFRLADVTRLWIELQVPVDSADFAAGDVLVVGATTATVRGVGARAAPRTQTLAVRAELAEAAGLRPGQWIGVRKRVDGGPSGAWQLPAGALVREQDRRYVFERHDAGFVAVPVQVLAGDAQHVTVTGALRAEVPVVVRGSAALKAAWQGHGGAGDGHAH